MSNEHSPISVSFDGNNLEDKINILEAEVKSLGYTVHQLAKVINTFLSAYQKHTEESATPEGIKKLLMGD
jgi:hypothetical protein